MKYFSETTTNPFLCDDCQQLGYCRKTREASVEDLLAKYYQYLSVPNKEYHFMKDADIINLVPVKTTVKDYYSTAGRKLQQAHDLFHQDEFEQASYLYRDLLMQRVDYNEAGLGLSVCYYFMKQYDEAASIATSISRFSYNDHLSSFLDACERAAREVEKNKTSTSESKQLQKNEILQTNCNNA